MKKIHCYSRDCDNVYRGNKKPSDWRKSDNDWLVIDHYFLHTTGAIKVPVCPECLKKFWPGHYGNRE